MFLKNDLEIFLYRNIISWHGRESTNEVCNAIAEFGRWCFYRVKAKELKPVHKWVKTCERFWTHRLDRVKQQAEQKMAKQPIRRQEEGSC